ncbi:hypothetical protein ACFOLD_14115 [Kocuria carniphila]|uniref:hypothetical protein n=1 Tax=Kocuria carniphila TaxID=262208 RepID=UPI003615C6CB
MLSPGEFLPALYINLRDFAGGRGYPRSPTCPVGARPRRHARDELFRVAWCGGTGA